MRLRELFDKLGNALLDGDVLVSIKVTYDDHKKDKSYQLLRPIEKLVIEDDGSVTLHVTQ